MLRAQTYADARAFLARAEMWLRKSEMENAVALQSARNASADDSRYERPMYWATVEDDDAIVGCAYRTPPYLVGVTALPEAAVPPLITSLAGIYAHLPGVSGPDAAARAFASAWTASRGGRWAVRARQRLYAHRLLVPEQSAPRGALRAAVVGDATRAQAWGSAFAREGGIASLDGKYCAALIQHGRLYFWDDGDLCCMVGVLRETTDAGAIGIIYTPPALRDRGYATASIRALSRLWLERGLKSSYVCADPDNPAADAICLRLGYEIIQDAVDIYFA